MKQKNPEYSTSFIIFSSLLFVVLFALISSCQDYCEKHNKQWRQEEWEEFQNRANSWDYSVDWDKAYDEGKLN